MKQKPLLSIILPITTNAAEYLPECLRSIFSQTYTSFEVIAIDDFSKDESFSILKRFHKADKRIKAFKNVKKYGMAVTLNRAIKKAKGKFITIVTPYDILKKDKLKKQVQFLLKNTKTIAVGTQYMTINGKKKIIEKSQFPVISSEIAPKPFHGLSVTFEGIMINSHKLPKDGLKFQPHPLALMYSDILMKLIQYGELVNLPAYLFYRRTLPTFASAQSMSKRVKSLIQLWATLQKYDYQLSLRIILSTLRNPHLTLS